MPVLGKKRKLGDTDNKCYTRIKYKLSRHARRKKTRLESAIDPTRTPTQRQDSLSSSGVNKLLLLPVRLLSPLYHDFRSRI